MHGYISDIDSNILWFYDIIYIYIYIYIIPYGQWYSRELDLKHQSHPGKVLPKHHPLMTNLVPVLTAGIDGCVYIPGKHPYGLTSADPWYDGYVGYDPIDG